MLTTNHSYGGVEFYRPDLVLRNHTLGDGYESPSYSSNRDTPVPDIEGKTSGTHRKRVPVACERCRKRKIKCSGDTGDGAGCENCKVAGHDSCQFLRVHSKPMQYPHTYNNAPRWHAHHYHPYSRAAHTSHQAHRAHQAQQYAQQHTSPYNTWQNGIEYSGFPTPTSTAVSWNTNTYPSTYQMYEPEHTSPYLTHPPSYMLPDPAHEGRPDMNYMASLSRSPQNSVWLDSTNSASISHQHAQNVSPVYPLTPAESTKSYSLLSQPGHVSLSYERTLPTPSQAMIHQTLPSQGRETPPLSAASHRSSQTWNTDSASNISVVSSRTSCGGSQDLTAAAQALTTCEDQAVIYSYQADEANPQLDGPISSLPVICEGVDNQPGFQQVSRNTPTQETDLEQLQTRTSRENLRKSSPNVYGYPNRISSRRSHVYPPRLMTSFNGGPVPVLWNISPSTPSSQHTSLTSQAVHPQSAISEEYSDDGQGRGSGSLDPIY